jgi:hypothetical protein
MTASFALICAAAASDIICQNRGFAPCSRFDDLTWTGSASDLLRAATVGVEMTFRREVPLPWRDQMGSRRRYEGTLGCCSDLHVDALPVASIARVRRVETLRSPLRAMPDLHSTVLQKSEMPDDDSRRKSIQPTNADLRSFHHVSEVARAFISRRRGPQPLRTRSGLHPAEVLIIKCKNTLQHHRSKSENVAARSGCERTQQTA